MAALIASVPLDERVLQVLHCGGDPTQCSRPGINRKLQLVFTIVVRERVFAGLRQRRSDSGVDAVVEYELQPDGVLAERGCHETSKLGSLDGLRPGGPFANDSLCTGKLVKPEPAPVQSDPTKHWDELLEKRPPMPERDHECPAVGIRGVFVRDGGYTVSAIQVCDPGLSPRPEPALLLFDANLKLELESFRCEADLPRDGDHVRDLRRVPIAVSAQSLSFTDRCYDTAATRDVVTYRVDADGFLWRVGVSREPKVPKRP